MLRLVADLINVSPSSSGLPGAGTWGTMLGWLQWTALAVAVGAMIVGGATWAAASQSGNVQHASNGKRAVIAAGVGAVLIGFGPHLIDTLFNIGSKAS